MWIAFGVVGGFVAAIVTAATIAILGMLVPLPHWEAATIALYVALIVPSFVVWVWFIGRCARWGGRLDRRRAGHAGKAWLPELVLLSVGILGSLKILHVICRFIWGQAV